MKKKLIASILAVSMMATLAVGMTLAYFTSQDVKTDTLTVGNVKIELSQTRPEKTTLVYAGEAIKQDPTVKNIGTNPCFVRIKVTGLNFLVPEGASDAEKDKWTIKLRSGGDVGALGKDWEYNALDGYYYYTKVLEADRPENLNRDNPDSIKTPPLFTHIVMPTALKGDDRHEWHDIVVTAEAIQAQGAAYPGWDAVQNMKFNDIVTWFGKFGLN